MDSSRRWAATVVGAGLLLGAPLAWVAFGVEPAGAAPPVVTQQPTNQTVNVGQTATFSAATNDLLAVPQWQLSTDGGATWSNISFANSDSYTTPATVPTDNGNEYRIDFADILTGSTASNPAVLTVDVPPVMSLQPANQSVNLGEPASFTAAAVGRPDPTIQWQVSTNGGASYADIPGAEAATLTVTPGIPDDGNLYRAFFSNGAGSTTSQSARLAVLTTAYRMVGGDGAVYSFGSDQFYGSMGGQPLNKPIVGMAASRSHQGYWLVASDGGIFAFGDAGFFGSTGAMTLNKPVVGMAATPDGQGYWLVASDGGIFAFGDAGFFGSTGAMTLNEPVVGMAATPEGQGYWLVASDGGIFAFGDAGFFGSTGGQPIPGSIIGLLRTADGAGYWLAGRDGSLYGFGDASLAGSESGAALNAPVVGISR